MYDEENEPLIASGGSILKFFVVLVLIIVAVVFVRGKYIEYKNSKNNHGEKTGEMCIETDCYNKASQDSVYCTQHGCKTCGQGRKHGGLYCYEHSCDKCVEEHLSDSKYCTQHSCLLCGEERCDNSRYCYEHRYVVR